jgi:diguanylate cyclase (GGDEF)-like protein
MQRTRTPHRQADGSVDADAEALSRLGRALDARSGDIADSVRRAWRKRCPNAAGADSRVDDDIVRTTTAGTAAVAQFLLTGDRESDEQKRIIAATGKAPLRDTISITDLTKLYLYWRDATIAAVRDAAVELGIEERLVAFAVSVVRAGSDSSVVRMVKEFDRERCRLRDDLAQEQDRLAHRAFHDALTGLPNRLLFFQRLTDALALRGRSSGTALLFIDVDNFKAVNDEYGHRVGDELLIAFAGRLQAAVRAGDTVARLGGDEFVVLCDDVEDVTSTTVTLAERIGAALREPVAVDADVVRATVSIGIAIATHDTDPDAIVMRADHAMYAAKRRGAGQHQLCSNG